MIQTFDTIRKEDVLTVGGKGANLGEMTAAGMAVPPGFVVTTDAYRAFLKENGLEDLFARLLLEAGDDREKLLEAAARFRARILEGVLPLSLAAEISNAYERLFAQDEAKDQRVAVRSSATAEDLPDLSFAGQQETYLNVTSIQGVLKQILHCYASLWGDRAVSYRQAQGYGQNQLALAVVIQKMVESETAGVLFTMNPITKNIGEIQINASYGLGESVVSGRVTPDSYSMDKHGKRLQTVIGEKKTEIVYGSEGTKEVPVSRNRQQAAALGDSELQALWKQAFIIERHYGRPMDIEWAIKGEKVFILQARAITAWKEDKGNQETEDFMKRHLKGTKVSFMARKNLAFILEKIPDAFYPFDSDMTAVINNQKSVIFSEVGMIMSVQPLVDDDGIETLPPKGFKITKDIFKLGRLMKQLKDFKSCHEILEEQMEGFSKELAHIRLLTFDSMGLSQCGQAIQDIYDFIRRLSYSRFYYGLFPPFIAAGKFDKIAKGIDPACNGADFLQNLHNRTAQLARSVATMAEYAKLRPELLKAIKEGKNYQFICGNFPEIIPVFHEFLEKHGYSSDFNCYCIHAKAFWENPDRLLYIIRPLLMLEQKTEANAKYPLLMEQARKKYGSKAFAQLEEKVNHLRYFHVMREESQYMWETAFYYIKQALKRAALLSGGDGDYFNNLAWLFKDEVLAACERGYINEGDREKIARRKKNRPLAKKVWERSKLLVFSHSRDVLKGVSGSSGQAVGRACIVNGPEEFYKLKKGDVLVCRLTDPEWTPLFMLAGAVVADTGAALSHAAIVAREYNIPAVLGVGFATQRFHDGDTLRVDGFKGQVAKILEGGLIEVGK